MTDELDSGLTDGTPSTPNEGGSQGKSDSGGSFDANPLQAAFDALARRVDEVDARSKSLQGDKDRGVKKHDAEISDLKRRFAEIEKLKKSGLDDDAAFEEHGFREDVRAVRERLNKLDPARPEPVGNGARSAEAADVVKKYGLDAGDPEVIERVLRVAQTAEQAELAALRIAYERTNRAPHSPAAAPALTGESAPSDPKDALAREYKQKIEALRQERPNPEKIAALKAEFRRKGLEVW